MNATSTASTLWLAFSCCGLISCASIQKTAENATDTVQKSTANATAKLSSYAKLPDLTDTPIARFMPAGGLKVVEVREKDLKELPTGHERALAYRNERKKGFWIFDGPIDFTEPMLPEVSGEMDGSLLPPKGP